MAGISSVELTLTEEQVWRAQGGRRPEQVRPVMRALMNRALEMGQALFQPRLAYAFFEVRELNGEQIVLAEGAVLHGVGCGADLAGAESVALALCSIGPALDERVYELLDSDMALAVSLDGVGSAAIDALSSEVCRLVEAEARAAGVRSSMPFSPGSGAWPLADQQAILGLLPAAELGVSLSRDYVMSPAKSLTLVFGVGKQIGAGGRPCQRCTVAPRCRYRVAE